MKPRTLLRTLAASALLGCGLFQSVPMVQAQTITNNWTNSVTSFWDNQFAWSAGVPTNNHAVFITNASSKTVIVDNFTARNYSNNLSVVSLTLNAPAGATNSLLVANPTNAAGVFVPVRFSDSLLVGALGALIVSNGAVRVEGSPLGTEFSVKGFVHLQDGFLTATSPPVNIRDNGRLQVSRGYFDALNVTVGTTNTGALRINGGTNRIFGQLLLDFGLFDTPTVIVNGGALEVTNGQITLGTFGGLAVTNGWVNANSVFIDTAGYWLIVGGTNVASSVTVGGPGIGAQGSLAVRGGLLQVPIFGVNDRGTLSQTGGRIETDLMLLTGGATVSGAATLLAKNLNVDGGSSSVGFLQSNGGNLIITNGRLAIGTVVIAGQSPQSRFTQSSGAVTAGNIVVGGASGAFAHFFASSGTVSVLTNLTVGEAAGSVGELIVSTTTVNADRVRVGEGGSGSFSLDFGSLVASNGISIGDSFFGEGYCRLNGTTRSPSLHIGQNGTLELDTYCELQVPALVVDGLLYAPNGFILTNRGVLNAGSEAVFEAFVQLANNWTNRGGWIHGAGALQVNLNRSLTGWGECSTPFVNSGTVEARNGDLVFDGPTFFNGSYGVLRNAPGASLIVDTPFITNFGILQANPGGGLIFSGQLTNAFTFNIDLLGGLLSTPLLRNIGSATVAGFGQINADVDNSSLISLTGPTEMYGHLTNRSTGTFEARSAEVFVSSSSWNDGTIRATDSEITFAGGLTNNGAYISDPSYNSFADLTVEANGYLTGGSSDTFAVTGQFRNRSTRAADWNTTSATLFIHAAQPHTIELAGTDRGATPAGYTDNFAWDTLRVVSGASVSLQDGNGTPGGALYVRRFILEGGLGQMSSIQGSGFNIYYDPAQSPNAYLGGLSYALTGGGALVPINAPKPQITSVTVLTNSTVRLNATGMPYLGYTIEASTNLVNWLAIGATNAPASGIMNFIDSDASIYPVRFYRFRQP